MKIYLKSLIERLSNYSQKLDTESLFTDKLWAVIDEDGHQQSYIFEGNGDLVMSKNGKVLMGKWKFYPQAKSIRIDRGNDQIFLNHGFFNKAIMVLKYDGDINDDLFVLVDKMQIPDLNIINYLKLIDYNNRQILCVELRNNALLLIENGWNKKDIKNLDVTIDEFAVPDGYYIDKNEEYLYYITNSKVINKCVLNTYISQGKKIIIAQRIKNDFYIGDYIFSEDFNPLQSGTYNVGRWKKIKVKEGKIVDA
jgi:hypothetical protein